MLNPTGEKTPSITLSFIGLSRNAQYISGTGTKTLLFQYIVAVNDENSDLVEMGSTINLNGTSISSSSGNNAILDLKPIKIGGIDAIIPLSPSGLSLHDPLTSPSNDSTPEITVFGVESLAKVELFSDFFCSTSVSSPESVQQNESTVNIIVDVITSDSTVTYYARQTDQAGNESPCSSSSLSYEYGEAIPNPPSDLSLHDPLTSPSNDSTPEITVSGVESFAQVQLFSDSSCNTSVSSSVSALENESTVHIIANTITSDGTVTYYTRQTNQAGDESPCSIASLSYEYDRTQPVAPSSLSLHDPLTSPNTDPTPEIIVSGVEPLATVQLFSGFLCYSSADSQESVPPNKSTVHIIANTITSDSTVTYSARQTDQAGNESPCSSYGATLSYEYDGTQPEPPSSLSLHDPSRSPSNDSTPEILVSGVEPLAKVELFRDNSCNTSVSSQESVPPNKFTVKIIANTIPSNGTITYYAQQTDRVGYVSLCSSASTSYEYDEMIPNPPSDLSLHDPLTSPSDDSTPEIIVSGVDPLATVELFSDSSCSTSVSSQESVQQNESTVQIIANTITSDSAVTYYARQTDQEGHASLCSSVSLFYEYDGTQPAPPSSLSLHDPSRSPSNDSTPEILVSGVEPLAKVELFSDSSCSTSVSSQESVQQNESTVQIIANTIPSNGTVTYYVRQTDRAGHASLCSGASLSYKYDEMIPNPPSGLSLHDPLTSPSTDSTPEIIVSGVKPLATVELFSDSSCNTSVSPQESVPSNDSTVHIIANTITSDSAVTYYARQTSQAGHASLCSSASLSYEYDGTIPNAPLGLSLHSPSTSPSNDSTPEILVSGVEPLAKVQLFRDSFCNISVSPQEPVPSSDSTVNITANTLMFTDTVTYYARQTDPAGNESPCSGVSLSYEYDGTALLDCSNVALAPEGYSNSRNHIVYSLTSTSFYRMDISGLTADVQQFEFCLRPDLKITADLKQSYLTENNSLVWEGQVAGTPASLAHQIANSIIFVKRNNELISTIWANGYPYRIWSLDGGLYQIERLAGEKSILDQPEITDLPISEEINTGESIPEISVIVVFTSNANKKVRDIYARSDLAIAEANFGYRASGIKARLKLAHAVAHSYKESSSPDIDLGRIIDSNDGHMDDIHTLRDQYEADVGILLTSKGSGVVKNILEKPESAFAYINYDVATGVYAFTHELGHLLGAQHQASLANMGSDRPYAFGHGYVDPDAAWRTVMAYELCSGCFRINLWANPNITILGEPAGNAVFSDNARVLNRNASAFASFRGEAYADLSGDGILLQNNAVVTDIEKATDRSVLYAIEVPAGATNLRIGTSGGTGDVNLYVKATTMVVPGFYDCAPRREDNNEECFEAAPKATRYHVLLYASYDFSDVTLRVQYDELMPLNEPSGLSLHDPLTSPSNDPTPEITVSGVESLAQVELFSDSSCSTSVSSSVLSFGK